MRKGGESIPDTGHLCRGYVILGTARMATFGNLCQTVGKFSQFRSKRKKCERMLNQTEW